MSRAARRREDVVEITEAALHAYRRAAENAAQRIATLEAENATLRTLLTECADELEWRIQDAYGARNQDGNVDADRIHPAMRGKYDDDMDTVVRARRALEGP